MSSFSMDAETATLPSGGKLPKSLPLKGRGKTESNDDVDDHTNGDMDEAIHIRDLNGGDNGEGIDSTNGDTSGESVRTGLSVQELRACNEAMKFHRAEALGMSCGTVTFDLEKGKILVLWNRVHKIHHLPKGRRNIGETMQAAALRETLEESRGVEATLLPLNIATRATPPTSNASKSPQVTDGFRSTEHIGAVTYPDPQADIKTLKTVYFYVATADSTVPPRPGTQEAWESIEPKWVTVDKALRMLYFTAEADVLRQAVHNLERTGYSVGGC